MTQKMVMVFYKWQQEIFTKETGLMERRMVMENIDLQMVIFTKVILEMETEKEKGLTHGLITVIIKENG